MSAIQRIFANFLIVFTACHSKLKLQDLRNEPRAISATAKPTRKQPK